MEADCKLLKKNTTKFPQNSEHEWWWFWTWALVQEPLAPRPTWGHPRCDLRQSGRRQTNAKVEVQSRVNRSMKFFGFPNREYRLWREINKRRPWIIECINYRLAFTIRAFSQRIPISSAGFKSCNLNQSYLFIKHRARLEYVVKHWGENVISNEHALLAEINFMLMLNTCVMNWIMY